MIHWLSTRWNRYRAARELKAAQADAESLREQLKVANGQIESLKLDNETAQKKLEAKDDEIKFLNNALQSELLAIRAMSMVHGQTVGISVDEVRKSFPKVAG